MTLSDTEEFSPAPGLTAKARASNAGNTRAKNAAGRLRTRVLMVQTQAENAGAQEISRILSDGLNKRGHDVHQTYLFRRTRSFEVTAKTSFCSQKRPGNPLALAVMLWRLWRIIRRTRPDTVFTFQHYGNIIAAPVARLAGVRHVVANRVSAVETMPMWLQRLDRLAGRMGLYSTIVVNSANVEAEYENYPASYRKRLERIDHGFQPKRSQMNAKEARAALGLPGDAVLLGCVARLHGLKNLDAAVRLLSADEHWHLALAGQGADRARLEALAQERGCRERLHFCGEMSPRRIGDFLAALDVFVFPSRAETFGLAAVEAAEAGLPVVANDLPVLREVLQIKGAAAAVFADADDDSAFAEAVGHVLANPALVSRLTLRGRRLAQKYGLNAMIERYETLIKRPARQDR